MYRETFYGRHTAQHQPVLEGRETPNTFTNKD